MANLFSNLRVYGGKWSVSGSRLFTQEEREMVLKAQVVDSQYGNSCCFFMKNGTSMFAPMSTDSKSGVGDLIDLQSAEIVTLSKVGEADITRIRG